MARRREFDWELQSKNLKENEGCLTIIMSFQKAAQDMVMNPK